jgi:hypothetical protein
MPEVKAKKVERETQQIVFFVYSLLVAVYTVQCTIIHNLFTPTATYLPLPFPEDEFLDVIET